MLSLSHILAQLESTARNKNSPPRLLAVSKSQTSAAIAQLAKQGQRAFGENYVQEAAAKQRELKELSLEWHLIGHLQSNKAELAATQFDWVQTVDRPKLVSALARHRSPERSPLNVLIQVNIDAETSKYGCAPQEIPALAALIAAEPQLTLRGLMAIPAPDPDLLRRRDAFRRMNTLYRQLSESYPHIDTLSMGMSDDFELAVAEGATLVRIGTALFGTRPPQ
ncbi:MAG: YggS family pyridoxal phosphate-dependent enzyme [Xanthomonadaceae bacterium]|jgi:pyridoxal phosphate enzyme (YggS family)|nr:YggS family pyridoxal phosphate-dependent enzyme [Xanthomonadaceae bacterium]